MAEISPNPQNGSNKKRAKKHSTRMDMTPMVDLAFLLLTFFMLTTTFNREKIMQVHKPLPINPPTPLPKNTVTILIGKNDQLLYYQGPFDPAKKENFHKTGFYNDQIRNELMNLNKKLYDEISEIEADYANQLFNDSVYRLKVNEAKKNKNNEGINVIIKSADDASYRSLVYILDEMEICNIVNYSIVDITTQEANILHSAL